MPLKKPDYASILKDALTCHRDGISSELIELPEQSVFPRLIPVQPATARKSRVTGMLLGRPSPRFIRRGRSIRYRLNDVLEWLDDAECYRSTAEVNSKKCKEGMV